MSSILQKIKEKTYNLINISNDIQDIIEYYENNKEKFRNKQKQSFLSFILYIIE
jgi:hypothetical protein